MPVHRNPQKTCIILTGPTASGKTALAVRLAQMLGTEIISCDSRQCFAELNIGVARPSAEFLQAVPHHFIASHSIFDAVNAAGFEAFALNKAKELFQENEFAVMTGGTGLYIRAFCSGLDAIPEVEEEVRATVMAEYQDKGIGWLRDELQKSDPLFSRQGEMQNPQRMMRALEVVRGTGKSILSFRNTEKTLRDFNIVQIGLDLPMQELTERIILRTESMMQSGLVEEVRQLLPYRNRNALQTVGYRELFRYFDGESRLDEAKKQIVTHTRQYAKRQLTWFRKDRSVHWCAPKEDALLELAHRLLQQQ